ncbi:MAG: hypothetical protein ACE5PO_01585 [Candidatus Bathyarchaeia archaeon]
MSDERRGRLQYLNAFEPLLQKLSLGKDKAFMPLYDSQYGCRYPEAERLLQRSHEETVRILNELAEKGLLDRKSVDKLVSCPACRSPHNWLRFLCPNCNSHKVIKNTLMEHVKCGHIGGEDQYAQKDRLACPRCKTHLAEAGGDYRIVGAWYECSDCKKRFSEPDVSLRCGKCGKISELAEVALSECYMYSLKEVVAKNAQFTAIQNLIVGVLKEQGYAVASPGAVPGASGVHHDFDVVAYQEDNGGAEEEEEDEDEAEDLEDRLLIDIATAQDRVGEQAVLTAFAKALDIGPARYFLIALPGLSPKAKKHAAQYKLNTIEAERPEEAVEALKGALTH